MIMTERQRPSKAATMGGPAMSPRLAQAPAGGSGRRQSMREAGLPWRRHRLPRKRAVGAPRSDGWRSARPQPVHEGVVGEFRHLPPEQVLAAEGHHRLVALLEGF